MFLYICENKRPDRTGENHYTTTSRSNPPTIEELMTHKKKSRLQRKKNKDSFSRDMDSQLFLFALLVEGKKERKKASCCKQPRHQRHQRQQQQQQQHTRSHSHYLRQIIKSGQPRQPQPLKSYHRAADPRTSYLPTTNQTQSVSE